MDPYSITQVADAQSAKASATCDDGKDMSSTWFRKNK